MASAAIPKITWGASFANTLNIGYPPDGAISFSVPREGSEWAQATTGARDAWVLGNDQRFRGTFRWIPTTATTDPVATGWDGSTGWRAFLEWAREMNPLRYYPDKDVASYHTCYLVEPLQGEPDLEQDGTRKLVLVLEDTTQTAWDGY